MAEKIVRAKKVSAEVAPVTVEEMEERNFGSAPSAFTSGNTVTVAYNGVQDIAFEVVTNSGETERLVVHGNAHELRGRDMGILPIGHFGFTRNVPAELWEAVKDQCLSKPPFDRLVKMGLLFATGTDYESNAEARNRSNTRNGVEPIDTTKTVSKESTTSE